jgi:hypothetical protein
MIRVRLKPSDAEESLRRIKRGLSEQAAKSVLLAATYLVGEIRTELYRTSKDGRTGRLPRSFNARFLGRHGNAVSAEAASDLVYAQIQDEGGMVFPRRSKYLSVPLQRIAVGKGPRDFPQLRLLPRRGRNSLLVQVMGRGKRRRIKPFFVLVPSVRIPARHYLAEAVRIAEPRIGEILDEGIDLVLERERGTRGRR